MSEVGKSVLQGAKEALAYAKGKTKDIKKHILKIPENIDVRAIRDNLHMSRNEFSNQFGFSSRTLEKWEQGMRRPEGPTRAYLIVIAQKPYAVQEALSNFKVLKFHNE